MPPIFDQTVYHWFTPSFPPFHPTRCHVCCFSRPLTLFLLFFAFFLFLGGLVPHTRTSLVGPPTPNPLLRQLVGISFFSFKVTQFLNPTVFLPLWSFHTLPALASWSLYQQLNCGCFPIALSLPVGDRLLPVFMTFCDQPTPFNVPFTYVSDTFLSPLCFRTLLLQLTCSRHHFPSRMPHVFLLLLRITSTSFFVHRVISIHASREQSVAPFSAPACNGTLSVPIERSI